MRVSTLLGLLFCNILWSGTYSVNKALMASGYHPLELSFLRYFIAALPLVVYCSWGGRRSLFASWGRKLGLVDLRIIAVGLLVFFVSAWCQMTGLQKSRAIDGSVLVAMEPLFTVLAAFVILRERVTAIKWLAIGIALVGVGTLTELTWDKFTTFTDARLVGNAIFMVSLMSEASYSVVSKPALDRRNPVLFVTVALVTGVLALFAHNMSVYGPERLAGFAPLFARASLWDWLAFLYLGLGCSLFGYLYWMLVLKDTPVSAMVLTLYLQPVLGVLLGHYWLGEAITPTTLIGSMLIIVAVWLGSWAASPRITSQETAAP